MIIVTFLSVQVFRKLFIFGGTRKRDDLLNDFFSYSVDTAEVEIIATAAAASNGGSSSESGASGGGTNNSSPSPAVGHTQRATIDTLKNEIYVMTVSYCPSKI